MTIQKKNKCFSLSLIELFINCCLLCRYDPDGVGTINGEAMMKKLGISIGGPNNAPMPIPHPNHDEYHKEGRHHTKTTTEFILIDTHSLIDAHPLSLSSSWHTKNGWNRWYLCQKCMDLRSDFETIIMHQIRILLMLSALLLERIRYLHPPCEATSLPVYHPPEATHLMCQPPLTLAV